MTIVDGRMSQQNSRVSSKLEPCTLCLQNLSVSLSIAQVELVKTNAIYNQNLRLSQFNFIFISVEISASSQLKTHVNYCQISDPTKTNRFKDWLF